MAATAAGLMVIKAPMRLGVVLVGLACAGTRLPWVLSQITAPVEKKSGPSAVYSKSDRAAGPICEEALALVHGIVEEGELPGAELAGGRSARSRTLVATSPEAPTTKPQVPVFFFVFRPKRQFYALS